MNAILVDLDGTLVDTHAANFLAYKTAIDEKGLPFDARKLEQSVGKFAWEQMLSIVLPEYKNLHLSIAKRKRQIYPSLIRMVRVNELLVNFLRMNQARVPIALVTSASRASVEILLKEKSLSDLFTVIITSDDVKNQKPNPEPYQAACALLSLRPADCVVFEDSEIGVDSARAFGAQIWRVEW